MKIGQGILFQHCDHDHLGLGGFDDKTVPIDLHILHAYFDCVSFQSRLDVFTQPFNIKPTHALKIAQDGMISDADRLFHNATPARAHIAFSASTTVAIWR